MRTLYAIIASVALLHSVVHGQADLLNETEALYAHAIKLMSDSPLIDTHVDLPQIIRGLGTFTFAPLMNHG
jgi:hypothetical protein